MRTTGSWNPADITPEKKKAGKEALKAAWEAGYTLFDHADIYAAGEAESLHGEFMKDAPSMRDEILIATKCGIVIPGQFDNKEPHRYDFSKEHILKSCEGSLKRLGIEQIDLYQLHRPDILMDPDEIGEAFERLHGSGKVKWFGVSNFSPSFVSTLQSGLKEPLVVNQVEISLSHLDCFTDGTLDQCIREKITPLSWSPVGGGWIASDEAPEKESLLSHWKLIGDMAKKYEVGRGEVCLAWLMKHPSVIVPIVGTIKPERIKSAVKATEIELSREDWYRLYVSARGERLP